MVSDGKPRERPLSGDRVDVRAEEMRDRGPTGNIGARATEHDAEAGRVGFADREAGYRHDVHTDIRTVEIPEAYNLTRDRARWGPIVAGFLTALTTLVALSVLGLAIGLTAADTRPAAVAGGTAFDGAGTFSAIWGAISAVIAFWLGGMVAGRTSAVFGREWGMFNGMMVAFLAIPVTLWLGGMGLGGLVGLAGGLVGALPDPTTAARQAVGAAQGAATQVTPADVARAAEAVRTTAWTTLLGLGLAIGASALGGAMGTRREIELSSESR